MALALSLVGALALTLALAVSLYSGFPQALGARTGGALPPSSGVADRNDAAGAQHGVSGAAALARLRSLPLQAQSSISGALGGTGSRYAAFSVRGDWQLQGGAVGARIARDGSVTVGAGGGLMSLRLLGAGRPGLVGRATTLATGGVIRAHGNRVLDAYGGLTEWLAAGPLGVEQGFTVTRRPAGGGPLTVAMRLGGQMRARRVGDTVLFGEPAGGVLRYGGLVALDARGRRLHASLRLDGHLLLLRVLDRDARYPVRIDPLFESSFELVGDCPGNCSGNQGQYEQGLGWFGYSVALSADAGTVLIGAPHNSHDVGAVWVFTEVNGVWTQAAQLLGNCTALCGGPDGTGEIGGGEFGYSVALSANGSTALIGAPQSEAVSGSGAASTFYPFGAAWVFTESGGNWFQQGSALSATYCTPSSKSAACTTSPGYCRGNSPTCNQPPGYEKEYGEFGDSVALSADGATALVGAPQDASGAGAAWSFTRSAGTWSAPTALTGSCTASCSGSQGTGETGQGLFGWSVALSPDGSTALIGAPDDNSQAGAGWVFSQSSGTWTQVGGKLVTDCSAVCGGALGTGELGAGMLGYSVALSGSGGSGTALLGAPGDNSGEGAAWMFTHSAAGWSQLDELLGDCSGTCTGTNGTGENGFGFFGYSVALSADGSTAAVGAANDGGENGAGWLFTEAGGGWSQLTELFGDCAASCNGAEGGGEIGAGQFGQSISVSGNGSDVAYGAPEDNLGEGAAWIAGTTPGVTASPVASGTPALDQTLSCSTGSWTNGPVGYDYQWDSGSSAVVGATSPTYTVQSDDLGGSVTCLVTAYNAAGASVPVASNAIAIPPATPVPTSPPTILPEGTGVDDQLVCLNASWTNEPYDFAYQWNRDGVPIENATDDTYTIAAIDEGSALTCTIVATSATANSNPVSTAPFRVPVESSAGCPAAGGKLSGSMLGSVRLGMTRAQALHAYRKSTDKRSAHADRFCLTPLPLTVGYGNAALLSALPKALRTQLQKKVVWASSEDPIYTVDGVRAGMSTPLTVTGLKIAETITAGANMWYAIAGRSAGYLVKANGGLVEELAVVDSRLVQSAATLRVLVTQLP